MGKAHPERRLTPKRFVLAWQRSSSPLEVARRLRMPLYLVECWAQKFVSAGVRLKPMQFANRN